MPLIAARTGIHRRDQAERRGEGHAAGRARDPNAPLFERLPEHLDRAARELRQLVEEEHAVVRQRDLAGPRHAAAADQRRFGAGVVRGAERSLAQQPGPGGQQTGDRMHGGDVERLLEGQRRQHPGETASQHRLAGAGRSDQQQMMAAGGRHFERAPRCGLPAQVGQVGRRSLEGTRGRRLGGGAPGHVDGSPRRHSIASTSVRTGTTRTPRTTAASGALAAGNISIDTPSRCRPAATGSAPRVGSTAPSSDSSPTMAMRAASGTVEDAAGGEDRHRDRQVEGRAGLADIGRRRGSR